MEQKELKMDVAAAAREALQERQPGEDLDEALLRSCKKLYGDSGVMAFEAIRNALEGIAQRDKVGVEQALQQIIDGRSSISVMTRVSTHKVLSGSLDDLSPEMRAEVEKAMASGKSSRVVVTSRVGGDKDLASSSPGATQTSRCENCGYEFSAEWSACPQCGKTKKRSFWTRLFGG